MTDTTYATTGTRIERPLDRGFKGVCAALANATGTDLVLWRVLFVVLTFFGGLGVVLYLAGMVCIPEEGEERSVADRLLHGPDRHLQREQVLLVVVFAVAAACLLHDANGTIAAVVAAALAVIWWRGQHERVQPVPGAAPTPAPTQAPTAVLTQVAAPKPPRPPAPPKPPVRRSPFTGLTISTAVLVSGALVLLGTTSTSVPAEVVLASALAVVGVGLVAGSFFGRSTGLIVLAALLGLALAGTAAVRPALDAGLGDRTWTPTGTGASYRLGVGEGRLDLSRLSLSEGQTYDLTARVTVGHLLVTVPQGMKVALDAEANLGDVEVFGVDTNGRHASKQLTEPGAQVTLHLSVRTGQVEVRRG